MLSVMKAELFRISKIKATKVVVIIGLLFVVLTQGFFKLDDMGIWKNLFSGKPQVEVVTPIKEGDHEIKLKAKKEVEITLLHNEEVLEPKDDKNAVGPKTFHFEQGEEKVFALAQPVKKTDNISVIYPSTAQNESLQIEGGKNINRITYIELGFVPTLLNGSGVAGFLQYIVLVFGIIILCGDFTHNRFKNYIHLKKSRGEIFFGKYLASFVAIFGIYIGLVLVSSLIGLALFGIGNVADNTRNAQLVFHVTNLFVSFFLLNMIAFLANVFQAKGGLVVGIYFLKGFTMGTFYTFFMLLYQSKQIVETFLTKTVNYWIENGTVMFLRNIDVVRGEINADFGSFVIFNIVYAVFFIGLAYLAFNKKEITS